MRTRIDSADMECERAQARESVMKENSSRRRAMGKHARILVLLVALAGAAHAETGSTSETEAPDLTDLSLEELMNIDLVYGASKYEQKVTEAPASVSIITAVDIRNYGWRTLSDILASVPGVFTTYDRNYSYVGVRGIRRSNDYNLRTLLLIDGHRANDSIYNSALIGTEELLNVDNIERAESPGEPRPLAAQRSFSTVPDPEVADRTSSFPSSTTR